MPLTRFATGVCRPFLPTITAAWLLLPVFQLSAGEAVRKWSSTQGTAIQAELVEVSGDKVVLKKVSGEKVQVQRQTLSKGDRDYLEEWARKNAAPPIPVEPLRYKDFQLGMTRDQLTQLVKDMKWEYDASTLPDSDQVFLKPGFGVDIREATVIGGGGKDLASWSRLCLSFRTNIVHEICLYGPNVPKASPEAEIVKWLEPLPEILTARHGPPTSALDRKTWKFQVLSALRNLGNAEVARWKLPGDQDVILRLIKEKREDLYNGQVVLRTVGPRKP